MKEGMKIARDLLAEATTANDEGQVEAAGKMLQLAKEIYAEESGEEVVAEVVVAEEKVAAEEEEVIDENFVKRIRDIRTKMTKLGPKKRRRLSQYGIGVIRPNSTVEELINALESVLAE